MSTIIDSRDKPMTRRAARAVVWASFAEIVSRTASPIIFVILAGSKLEKGKRSALRKLLRRWKTRRFFKMKIPKEIFIGETKYRIKKSLFLYNRNIGGQINYSTRIISI